MAKHVCQYCVRRFEVPPDAAEGTEITCPFCGKRNLLSPTQTAKPRDLTLEPLPPTKGLSSQQVSEIARDIIANVEKVIVGKHDQVTLAVATLLAEGHLVVEDVPGVAKTMLARALAQSAGCTFKRIQCTPDLQPSDVLGETFVDAESGRSEFRSGPLFAQIVLVDEINRASPRTQAALLEAMGEGMITKGRITYDLERPFMVLATQNPIEQEGTFRLPEAQLDRFLIRLTLGYPALENEQQMCDRFQLRHPIETLKSVTTPDRVIACQEAVREVQVGPAVRDYALAIVTATRGHPKLLLGASPRASLGLLRISQALAAIQGNSAISTDRVKGIAQAVLAHRVIVRGEAGHSIAAATAVIEEILNRTSAPKP
jgi:MoxR-like ATPase